MTEKLELMDIKTLSERLKISRWTLYLWAETGLIPCLRLGKRLLFRPCDIEKWLSEKTGIVSNSPATKK